MGKPKHQQATKGVIRPAHCTEECVRIREAKHRLKNSHFMMFEGIIRLARKGGVTWRVIEKGYAEEGYIEEERHVQEGHTEGGLQKHGLHIQGGHGGRSHSGGSPRGGSCRGGISNVWPAHKGGSLRKVTKGFWPPAQNDPHASSQ
eukprot:1160617-Pelagomonas_calceolata.AAC.4